MLSTIFFILSQTCEDQNACNVGQQAACTFASQYCDCNGHTTDPYCNCQGQKKKKTSVKEHVEIGTFVEKFE